MPKSVEELEKFFADKLDSLEPDIEAKCMKTIREEVKETINELKKTRDFTPAVGIVDKDSEIINKLCEHPKIKDTKVPDMSGIYGKIFSPKILKAMAGFMSYVYMVQNRQGDAPDIVHKALAEGSLATGGAFVPIEFSNELLRLVIEKQVVRPRAKIIPMQTDMIRIPRIVDTSHTTTIHGGMKGTWTAEAGTIAQADPVTGQVQLIAKKFTDAVQVSNELLMDSPISIAPLLDTLFTETLGFWEDNSAMWGLGAGEMVGAFTASNPARIAVTRTTTSHVKTDDILNMYARMFPSSLNNAVWVCSPAVFPELAKMSIAVGTGGSLVWLTNYTTIQGAPPASILGRPLIISEKMATLGSASDVAFCDFSYYLIGDRMQMVIDLSEHVAFATDETYFRAKERLDGMPWLSGSLTPKNGGDTLSAFVTLAA